MVNPPVTQPIGDRWWIYALRDGAYAEVGASATFLMVPKERLYGFLARAREDEVAAELGLRDWVMRAIARDG